MRYEKGCILIKKDKPLWKKVLLVVVIIIIVLFFFSNAFGIFDGNRV